MNASTTQEFLHVADSVATDVSRVETSLLDEAQVHAALTRACARIAPTWPLDQFIAVNPYWGFVEQPIAQVGEKLARLAGSPLLMPPAWYQQAWREGQFKELDLVQACAIANSDTNSNPNHNASSVTLKVADLVVMLESANAPLAYSTQPRLPLLTHIADAADRSPYHMPWRDYVTHSLSQWCAAYYDQHQAQWHADRANGLYPMWRQAALLDRSPAWQMGLQQVALHLQTVPSESQVAVHWLLAELNIPAALLEDYLTALLLSLNGWAAWGAYQAWQAQLQQQTNTDLLHILAARLSWEYLLYQGFNDLPSRWHKALQDYQTAWQSQSQRQPANQHVDALNGAGQDGSGENITAAWWAIQHAHELAYQRSLLSGLQQGMQTATPMASVPSVRPAVQAAFCIDVRSEIMRRALEACSPAIQTLGFAGFFGLPIDYMPLASKLARPQLPGLLAAKLRVTDEWQAPLASANVPAAESKSEKGMYLGRAKLAQQRTEKLGWQSAWQGFKRQANASFSFVETLGLSYAWHLLTASWHGQTLTLPERVGLSTEQAQRIQPRITTTLKPEGGAASGFILSQKVELAKGVLKSMSLAHPRQTLAPLVLLVGHGSQSVNNPHATGLDCGACCGQTGEVNARALAALLNEPAVRDGLQAEGMAIPADTWFVPALHNTTTDAIELFDTDPDYTAHATAHISELLELRGWLVQAQRLAQTERAARLGLAAVSGDASTTANVAAIAAEITARAMDWSQVRPEWALADNAAFIVAPRTRTQHLELAGRTFLHDYQHEADDGYAILELIMTAPMVVAHWINMQYYASTVDNPRYGSGNKVLHNVVGGHIGVFEGNGGDLRIGLPLQSLHNGERWMHTPLRLTVCIEAPQAPMTAIVEKHPLVRQLLDHGWIHLFQMAPAPGKPAIARYNQGQWQPWEDFHLPD